MTIRSAWVMALLFASICHAAPQAKIANEQYKVLEGENGRKSTLSEIQKARISFFKTLGPEYILKHPLEAKKFLTAYQQLLETRSTSLRKNVKLQIFGVYKGEHGFLISATPLRETRPHWYWQSPLTSELYLLRLEPHTHSVFEPRLSTGFIHFERNSPASITVGPYEFVQIQKPSLKPMEAPVSTQDIVTISQDAGQVRTYSIYKDDQNFYLLAQNSTLADEAPSKDASRLFLIKGNALQSLAMSYVGQIPRPFGQALYEPLTGYFLGFVNEAESSSLFAVHTVSDGPKALRLATAEERARVPLSYLVTTYFGLPIGSRTPLDAMFSPNRAPLVKASHCLNIWVEQSRAKQLVSSQN